MFLGFSVAEENSADFCVQIYDFRTETSLYPSCRLYALFDHGHAQRTTRIAPQLNFFVPLVRRQLWTFFLADD
jgi:hypothetical protein